MVWQMNLGDALAPVSLKKKMEGVVTPFTGNTEDPEEAPKRDEPFDIPQPSGEYLLYGPEVNGKPVQLSCHEACLPLCSAIEGTDVKMPCWLNDRSTRIFGQKLSAVGGVSLLMLLVLLATTAGFVGGRRFGMAGRKIGEP